MKIALVHKRLDLRGGTERDLFRTAEGLRDLGHEVHLFCSEFGITPPVGTAGHRIPVVPLGRTARLWSFLVAAPKILRRASCDVVVNFGRMLSQDVIRSGGGPHRVFLQKLGREGGMTRRIWQSISPYHQSLLAMEKKQFEPGHYKKVLAVSEAVKRELTVAYGVPPHLISVIYNGVDHERFHPALREQSREAIKTQWHVPVNAPTVLFVGSGFRRKGLDRLLNVWKSPRLKGVYLLVVGDDAQRDAYEGRSATGNIVFVGRQENVQRYYGAADLVVLPAIQEAFGNVVLEALASGVPVVVSNTVGAAEVLKGSLAEGILAHADDPTEIEAKLLAMLGRAQDQALRVEARKLAE